MKLVYCSETIRKIYGDEEGKGRFLRDLNQTSSWIVMLDDIKKAVDSGKLVHGGIVACK